MTDINLEEGKIRYEGQLLSEDDLTRLIQEKMNSGEMKFAGLALALEKLKRALENTRTLEVQMRLSRDEHQRLKTLGGGNVQEGVRKAVLLFLRKGTAGEGRERPAVKPAAPPSKPPSPAAAVGQDTPGAVNDPGAKAPRPVAVEPAAGPKPAPEAPSDGAAHRAAAPGAIGETAPPPPPPEGPAEAVVEKTASGQASGPDGSGAVASRSGTGKKQSVTCAKCKQTFEIDASEHTSEAACPHCGTTGRFETEEKGHPRYQDHFLG